MNVLVIGYGSIGQRHARNLNGLGHDVIVYDPLRVSEKDGDSLTFTFCLEDALNLQPDAVIICSPPALHEEHALAAFPHCSRVFIEKPMALRTDAAIRICQQAEAFGVTVGVGFMERAHPTVRLVKRDIDGGELGAVRQAIVQCWWKATPKSYPWAGILPETSHSIDLALWLFGPVEGVDTCRILDNDYRAEVILRHASGTKTILALDANTKPFRCIALSFSSDRIGQFNYGEPDEWDACYRAELDAFLKGEPLCSAREALETVKLCEGMQ